MSAAKWFRISCSSLRCKWTSTRRAETREDATERTCPRCGARVLAAPTGSVGLGTVLFRHDGGGGITK